MGIDVAKKFNLQRYKSLLVIGIFLIHFFNIRPVDFQQSQGLENGGQFFFHKLLFLVADNFVFCVIGNEKTHTPLIDNHFQILQKVVRTQHRIGIHFQLHSQFPDGVDAVALIPLRF